MNETLNSLTVADLNQRYADTLVYYNKKLIYVVGFEPGPKGLRIRFEHAVDKVQKKTVINRARPVIDWNAPIAQQATDVRFNQYLAPPLAPRVAVPRRGPAVPIFPTEEQLLPVIDPLEDPVFIQLVRRNHRDIVTQLNVLEVERTRRNLVQGQHIQNIRDYAANRAELSALEAQIGQQTDTIGRMANRDPIDLGLRPARRLRDQLRAQRVELLRRRDAIVALERGFQEPPVVGQLQRINVGPPGEIEQVENEPQETGFILNKDEKSYVELFDYRALETKRPLARWYLVEKNAPHYLWYTDSRQYQRGHAQRNTVVSLPESKQAVGWERFISTIAKAYDEQSLPDLRFGLNQFKKARSEQETILLSPSLLIHQDGIFYRNTKIGEFKAHDEVFLLRPQFDQELQERIVGLKVRNGG